jgi:hypothetical protein
VPDVGGERGATSLTGRAGDAAAAATESAWAGGGLSMRCGMACSDPSATVVLVIARGKGSPDAVTGGRGGACAAGPGAAADAAETGLLSAEADAGGEGASTTESGTASVRRCAVGAGIPEAVDRGASNCKVSRATWKAIDTASALSSRRRSCRLSRRRSPE